MHILVADDHVLLVDMLASHLQKLGDDVLISKAINFEQAMEVVRTAETLRLVLLDLHMPGMNGVDEVRTLRARSPSTPVAIISGDNSPNAVRASMEAGAVGFLPKTMGGRAILHAVRLILSGEKFLPAELYLKAVGLERSSPAIVGGETLGNLSSRERDVLAQLVGGRSNKEIARALNIEVVTVTAHLGSIYRKLGAANRTQAVTRAIEAGFGRDQLDF
ncbi:MAG: response regulator transcription factor [Proteobacteria bacterium]|nr:response regulator transcription factor [Pseudomonadota bacterium]